MGQKRRGERETKREEIKWKMKGIAVKDARGGFEWRTISQDFLCSICIFLPPLVVFTAWRKSSISSSLIWCDGWFELRRFWSFFFCVLRTAAVFRRWLMASLCEWQCEGKCSMLLLAQPRTVTFKRTFVSDVQQVHSIWFIRVTVCQRQVFQLSPFGCLLTTFKKEIGYLHSAPSSRTIIAHLIPNWSWHEDIRHGECSWTLAVVTAVDVSISALYFMCLVRVVTCTAEKETTPHTHSLVLWIPTILDYCVFATHP